MAKKGASDKKGTKEKKRNYENDYVSVTQVLDILRKPGLEMWFKMNSKEECDALSKKAKAIGTQIHSLIESYIKGEVGSINTLYPGEVNAALKSFLKFRKEHPQIKLSWAEMQIINDHLELNGTLDCIGEESGATILLDWKTGECKEKETPRIYFEYFLQVAAYTKLYEEKHAPSSIKRAYILVLAKDKVAYALEEVGQDILFRLWTLFSLLLFYVHGRKSIEKKLKNKEE